MFQEWKSSRTGVPMIYSSNLIQRRLINFWLPRCTETCSYTLICMYTIMYCNMSYSVLYNIICHSISGLPNIPTGRYLSFYGFPWYKLSYSIPDILYKRTSSTNSPFVAFGKRRGKIGPSLPKCRHADASPYHAIYLSVTSQLSRTSR